MQWKISINDDQNIINLQVIEIFHDIISAFIRSHSSNSCWDCLAIRSFSGNGQHLPVTVWLLNVSIFVRKSRKLMSKWLVVRACVCDCSSIAVVDSSRPHVEKRRGCCFCGKVEGKNEKLFNYFCCCCWLTQTTCPLHINFKSSVAHRIDCAEQVSKWVRQRDWECSLTTYLSQTHTTQQPKNGKMELIKIFYRIDFIFLLALTLGEGDKERRFNPCGSFKTLLPFRWIFLMSKISTRIKYKKQNVKEKKKKQNQIEMKCHLSIFASISH